MYAETASRQGTLAQALRRKAMYESSILTLLFIGRMCKYKGSGCIQAIAPGSIRMPLHERKNAVAAGLQKVQATIVQVLSE